MLRPRIENKSGDTAAVESRIQYVSQRLGEIDEQLRMCADLELQTMNRVTDTYISGTEQERSDAERAHADTMQRLQALNTERSRLDTALRKLSEEKTSIEWAAELQEQERLIQAGRDLMAEMVAAAAQCSALWLEWEKANDTQNVLTRRMEEAERLTGRGRFPRRGLAEATGVTPSFLKSFRELGYHLTHMQPQCAFDVQEPQRARSLGRNPDGSRFMLELLDSAHPDPVVKRELLAFGAG
jgi:hypothetical protein